MWLADLIEAMDASRAVKSELSHKLCSIDRYIQTKSHLPKIRLFFQLIKLGGGRVAKECQLRNFHSILSSHPVYKKRALEMLQYILIFIGVRKSKIIDFDLQALEYCKVELSYPSAIVGICNEIATESEDFQKLRSFAGEHLECDPDNIETMEDLCLSLHYMASAPLDDVYQLAGWLEKIGRKDLSIKLVDFTRTRKYEDPRFTAIHEELKKPVQATDGNESLPANGGVDRVTFIITGDANDDIEKDTPLQPEAGETTDGVTSIERVTSFSKQDPADPHLLLPDQTRTFDRQVSVTSNASEEDDETHELILVTEKDKNHKNSQPRLVLNFKRYLRRQQTRRPLCALVCASTTCFVLALLAIVGSIGFGGIYGAMYASKTKTVYATDQQVVIVAEFSDPLAFTSSSICECPTHEDVSHTNRLYIVPQVQLLKHTRLKSHSSDVLNQIMPNCVLNLISDHLYLLSGSTINFHICLTSSKQLDLTGTLLIFDNFESHNQYILGNNCPRRDLRGMHTHNLNIGYNQFKCTHINYTSQVNGYHYIIADTPGSISFYYNYTYLQYYLNPDDFTDPPSCSFGFNSENDCDLGAISRTPVYLVVSVLQSEIANSFSTHLCFETDVWTNELITLVCCLSAVFLIAIFLAMLFCICSIYKCRR